MDLICIYLKVATGCGNFYMLSTIKKFQTIFEKFSIHRICKHFEKTEPRLNLYTQKMRAKNPDKSRLTALKNAGDRDRTGTGITTHGILSPGRLPVPPRRHYHIGKKYAICKYYISR